MQVNPLWQCLQKAPSGSSSTSMNFRFDAVVFFCTFFTTGFVEIPLDTARVVRTGYERFLVSPGDTFLFSRSSSLE